MAVLPMRYLPDPILRERTRRVTSIGPTVQRLIDDMIDTMHAEHGVGIAANQVGSLLRVAVIEIPRDEASPETIHGVHPERSEWAQDELREREASEQGVDQYVLINPQIVRRAGEREVEEGCLSLPGLRGRLARSVKVTARATDRSGQEYRIRAEGLLAQALEHETDHLKGTVYIDRMEVAEDLWALVPAGEAGERPEGPTPEAAWRMRRPAPPVVRRG